MKKNKLIIHIGTHKTGTTSIQNALYASKEELKKAGFLYAKTDREPHPRLHKHCSIYFAASSGDALADLERQTLFEEFQNSGCHTMILSEEGLSMNKRQLALFF